MAFNTIDPTTPAGNEKKKFGDDRIREFKQQTIDNLTEISNYPASTMSALKTAVWTTATRPSGTELVDRITGYNTDLGCEEYYDLASTSWKTKAPGILSEWTVAGRPTSPLVGQYGYNTDLAVIERWNGSLWKRVSAGRRGDVKMWSGAINDIEPGWVLADGVQRTHPEGGTYTPPNLFGRFIPGADGGAYPVGATGGEATHVLTINEMPVHHHDYYVPVNGGAGTADGSSGHVGGGPYQTVDTGSGWPHENRPPYYALCYLYKI